MDLYLLPFRKYAIFSGRAGRPEYWVFSIANAVISVLLTFVDGLIGTVDAGTGVGALGLVFNLIILIPSIAVTVRRLHDTGRSGWWLLLVLLPLIGALVILVFMLLASNEGDNEYGTNPGETS